MVCKHTGRPGRVVRVEPPPHPPLPKKGDEGKGIAWRERERGRLGETRKRERKRGRGCGGRERRERRSARGACLSYWGGQLSPNNPPPPPHHHHHHRLAPVRRGSGQRLHPTSCSRSLWALRAASPFCRSQLHTPPPRASCQALAPRRRRPVHVHCSHGATASTAAPSRAGNLVTRRRRPATAAHEQAPAPHADSRALLHIKSQHGCLLKLSPSLAARVRARRGGGEGAGPAR